MNEEQRASQLSAMFDGELPAAECELLARRITRDDTLRAAWARYAVIGAAMRRERVPLDLQLAARVRAAVSAEPVFGEGDAAAPALAAPRRASRWLRPVAGLAAAAVVAGIAVIGLRGRDAQVAGPAVASVASTVAPAPAATVVPGPSNATEPESYVVPVASEPVRFVPPARLANYVVAHSEVSMPLSRRNILSALIATEQDDGAAPAPGVADPDAR
ncbi:MAG: sigma-E factor negative regulatory protein [Steroidobacteraceae bacterium]